MKVLIHHLMLNNLKVLLDALEVCLKDLLSTITHVVLCVGSEYLCLFKSRSVKLRDNSDVQTLDIIATFNLKRVLNKREYSINLLFDSP